MNIKIYCNYGVLGAEKRKKYTFGAPHATADCWEEMKELVLEKLPAQEN